MFQIPAALPVRATTPRAPMAVMNSVIAEPGTCPPAASDDCISRIHPTAPSIRVP